MLDRIKADFSDPLDIADRGREMDERLMVDYEPRATSSGLPGVIHTLHSAAIRSARTDRTHLLRLTVERDCAAGGSWPRAEPEQTRSMEAGS